MGKLKVNSPVRPARLRYQITLSPSAARLLHKIQGQERRNRSNTLEVLIEREHERRQGKVAA